MVWTALGMIVREDEASISAATAAAVCTAQLGVTCPDMAWGS